MPAVLTLRTQSHAFTCRRSGPHNFILSISIFCKREVKRFSKENHGLHPLLVHIELFPPLRLLILSFLSLPFSIGRSVAASPPSNLNLAPRSAADTMQCRDVQGRTSGWPPPERRQCQNQSRLSRRHRPCCHCHVPDGRTDEGWAWAPLSS